MLACFKSLFKQDCLQPTSIIWCWILHLSVLSQMLHKWSCLKGFFSLYLKSTSLKYSGPLLPNLVNIISGL